MDSHDLFYSVTRKGTPGNPDAQPRGMEAFTLLEILIALALVAILIAASLPYLYDAQGSSEADRTSDAMVTRVQEIRKESMESGVAKELQLSSNGIAGLPLPGGWSLQLKGINDSAFHPPQRGETWTFSPEGICQPLELRLSNGEKTITLSFDALTGQVLHDH